MRIYSFYPTLLNAWAYYYNEVGYEDQNGEWRHYVPDIESLLNIINRVPTKRTPAQIEGQRFEDAVLKRIPMPYGAEEAVILKAQSIIGRYGFADMRNLGTYQIDGDIVNIYGLIDWLGGGTVFDLKKIGRYKPGMFCQSHQIWYAVNLEQEGFRKMSYVINSDNDIYTEEYRLSDVDLTERINEVRGLISFVNDYAMHITNDRIYSDIRHEYAKVSLGYRYTIKQI